MTTGHRPDASTESAPTERLRLYGDIVHQLDVGAVVLRLDDPGDLDSFRLMAHNPAAVELLGVALDHYVGQTVGEVNPGTLTTEMLRRAAEALRTRTSQNLPEVQRPDDAGSGHKVVSGAALPLSGSAVALIFDDITARKRSEEEMRRMQDLMMHAMRLAQMGSWHWDLASDTVVWSTELYDIYGVEPGTPVSFETFLGRLHPDDRQRVHDAVRAALERPGPFRFDERVIRPDDSVRVLDSQGDVILGDDGRPVALIGFCRDVTEERKSMAALAERERRFATLFHASPVAISVSTLADGRLLDVNQRWCDLTGYTREEAIGHLKEELRLWAEPDQRTKLVAALRASGSVPEADFLFRTKSGMLRRVLAAAERITIDREVCVLMHLLRT